jgi:hypothetical protein
MFDVCSFLYAVFSVCGAQIISVGGPKAKLNAALNGRAGASFERAEIARWLSA